MINGAFIVGAIGLAWALLWGWIGGDVKLAAAPPAVAFFTLWVATVTPADLVPKRYRSASTSVLGFVAVVLVFGAAVWPVIICFRG